MQPGHYRRLLTLAATVVVLALASRWLWGQPASPLLLGIAHYLVRPCLGLLLVGALLVGWLFVGHHPGRMMGEPERGVLPPRLARALRWLNGLSLLALVAASLTGGPAWVVLLALAFVSPLGALPVTLMSDFGIAFGFLGWCALWGVAGLLAPPAACFVRVAYPLVLGLLMTFFSALPPAPHGHPLGGRRIHGLWMAVMALLLLLGSNGLLRAAQEAQCQEDLCEVYVSLPFHPREAPQGYTLESEEYSSASGEVYVDCWLRCQSHPDRKVGFMERIR